MPPWTRGWAALRSPLRAWRDSLPPFLRTHKLFNPRDPSSRERTIFGYTLLAAQVFFGIHFTFEYLFAIRSTSGVSMVPTIPHSYAGHPSILIYKLWYRRGRNIRVGDVVEFKHPVIPGASAVKRVVGMPGDFVSVVTPGRLEVELDPEGDVWDGGFARVEEEVVRVPEGHCWLAGDNLEWSRDSRILGPVPLGLVKGKVVALVLPWRERKWFGNGLVDLKEEHGEPVIAKLR
ncbi:peptidase S24/S26A/S26B/S26C [Clohesyomyces aquaticus]|uniref:Mitochondrial inner membrane protease subunit n=1 Tax=Clohesyomyces aquaticus TaxID=1231657 RepID=A0A1Y1YSD8_9PLEO|nr:peptidase S24/S26A/S26B/S26C [Clohesyomyces aquaticus]